ncbi:preprotein translocase subunit SecG [Nisaea sp.]|uniref:preprotein translocase subunit SecG n=1 Tax=Nisaea sp. TaxID=2024842 RepID=UPI003B520CAB
MTEVLLAIHLMIALALVIVVLLQRSEGGGLGIGGGGGGGGGMGGFMSARGTANLLTRSTAILATAFFATSILLAILAETNKTGSIADQVQESSEPAAPSGPQVPLSQ